MEENLKKEKIKEISKIAGICVGVLICLFIISFVMFKIFTNIRQEEMQTLSKSQQNGKENTEIGEEVVELIDPESIEEEQLEDNEKEDDENLTEEEKQKREEEKKKQEEERKKKEEEEKKNQAQKYPYWIKVNYSANTVTVYGKDAEGNYTVPVKAMVCSAGASTPKSGVYKTPQKARWGTLIGPSYGQYCTRITGQILFHSVPYLKRDGNTILEYWEYDRLGETRSLGCVRLTVADAKWLYDNCPLGTSVEFYSSAIPGPLGKPGAKKISGYDDSLRVWDPTDPDPNNPWRNQTKKEEEERKAKEEAERKAKEEAEKKAKEEAERKAKDAEAKKKAEQEQARKAAEQEAARKKAEQEEARRQEEKRRQEEAERIRREQEEAERIRREQEAQNNAGNTSNTVDDGENSNAGNNTTENGNTVNDNTVNN